LTAVDIAPVRDEERRQPLLDLFLIFAGANIVATTLLTGASLVPALGTGEALAVVVAGSLVGSALVGCLAPVGTRLGVPSVIAARAALGRRGADLLALLLYVTNFAWIALNNVIAGSACVEAVGGMGVGGWAVLLGLAATAVVAFGPHAVAVANRLAVPVMVVLGLLLLIACGARLDEAWRPGVGQLGTWRGFDLVVGYQVSWILMFADYSRYSRSVPGSAAATFLGLAFSSLWFMPVGVVAALLAGSSDPGRMVAGAGLGSFGAVLLALGSVTTNFVNVYLSALAWKSLRPGTNDQVSVWLIGGIGAALGLLSRAWLDRYVDFMYLMGSMLVPVGGVLISRLLLSRVPVVVAHLYEPRPAWSGPGMLAWIAGYAAYHVVPGAGTMASLAVAMAVHQAAHRLRGT
jgi:cytosine permease